MYPIQTSVNVNNDNKTSITMSSCKNIEGNFTVESDSCKYTDEAIISDYS